LGEEIENKEMGWAYCTCGDRRGAYRVWVGRPEGKKDLENLGLDGRIILKWILKSGMVKYGLD
jgi:hypothetical protein